MRATVSWIVEVFLKSEPALSFMPVWYEMRIRLAISYVAGLKREVHAYCVPPPPWSTSDERLEGNYYYDPDE